MGRGGWLKGIREFFGQETGDNELGDTVEKLTKMVSKLQPAILQKN